MHDDPHGKPLATAASRSSPARRAASAAPPRWRLRSRRRPCRRRGPHRQGGLEELDDAIQREGGTATLVPLDLKDFDGIDRLGAALFERWGRLDILVGNAGVLGPLTPLGHVEPKDWDKVMAVNVTANWRLIRSLDPLLRASDAGRAVFIYLGRRLEAPRPIGAPTRSPRRPSTRWRAPMRPRPRRRRSRSMLVNPGPLRTRMRATAMPGEDPLTLKTPDDLAPHLVAMASPSWTESGKLFDFPTQSVMEFRFPG